MDNGEWRKRTWTEEHGQKNMDKRTWTEGTWTEGIWTEGQIYTSRGMILCIGSIDLKGRIFITAGLRPAE
jgi:hypothetical protein